MVSPRSSIWLRPSLRPCAMFSVTSHKDSLVMTSVGRLLSRHRASAQAEGATRHIRTTTKTLQIPAISRAVIFIGSKVKAYMIWLTEMNLQSATLDQALALRNWFPDPASLAQWGGPEMPCPPTREEFLEGMHWERMPTYVAVDVDDEMLAFGQYYERYSRCHLARLAVRPDQRGKGTGQKFIAALMQHGTKDLDLAECGLFVMSDNPAAQTCYQRLGFEHAAYPSDMKRYEGVQYMVRVAAY